MFKFKIEVSESEKTIRDRINENMKEDRKKAEKSILSWSPDYERGLHFLNNDEKICGFYQHMDQFNQIFKSVAIKDDPGRAYFKGKFINENDNLVFKGFIYTNWIKFVVLIIFLIITILSKRKILILVALWCIASLIYNEIKLYKLLKRFLEKK